MITQNLNNICYQLGQDIFYTQAAGGNVSIKEENSMLIKASGKWLSEAINENIFTEVKLDIVFDAISKIDLSALNYSDSKTLKPSIETVVHAVIPYKIVVHIHHINSIVHLIHKECETLLNSKLKKYSFPYKIVRYAKPGLPLAKEIQLILKDYPKTKVFLLKNHGVFFSANSLEEVVSQINELNELLFLESSLRTINIIQKQLLFQNSKNREFNLFPESIVQSMVHQKNSKKLLEFIWPIYPDHLVFLGSYPNFITKKTILNPSQLKLDDGIYFVENYGVFYKGNISQSQRQYLICFAHIFHRIIDHKKVSTLNSAEVDEIVNWESEKYRIKLSL